MPLFYFRRIFTCPSQGFFFAQTHCFALNKLLSWVIFAAGLTYHKMAEPDFLDSSMTLHWWTFRQKNIYRIRFLCLFGLTTCGLWDLSSPTRDWTWALVGKPLSPNCWTAREFPTSGIFQRDLISVQFSYSVMSNSLRPHEPQHARPPCPSPTPRFYSNSYPLSQWCQPTISSSVIPFSSCLQSFPASGSFQMSQLFESGDQSIGVSASASVLPVNIQDWCPLGWTGWISLQCRGLSRVCQHHSSKHQFFGTQLSLQSNSHIHTWLLEKP